MQHQPDIRKRYQINSKYKLIFQESIHGNENKRGQP